MEEFCWLCVAACVNVPNQTIVYLLMLWYASWICCCLLQNPLIISFLNYAKIFCAANAMIQKEYIVYSKILLNIIPIFLSSHLTWYVENHQETGGILQGTQSLQSVIVMEDFSQYLSVELAEYGSYMREGRFFLMEIIDFNWVFNLQLLILVEDKRSKSNLEMIGKNDIRN